MFSVVIICIMDFLFVVVALLKNQVCLFIIISLNAFDVALMLLLFTLKKEKKKRRKKESLSS